ncbi:MAG: excinuclease ABC subunit C [Chlorobiaceae bacterium]|nr:excinuclease ABC subunit C [Chlorobiaceae bacterium]
MKHYIYILKSLSADKFYIGYSQNPAKRLLFHNTIDKGFTARFRPWEIIFTQEFSTKQEALFAERKIKNWKSKEMINLLIEGIINI